MNVYEAAQIYTDLVNTENEIPADEFNAKTRINVLRSKYHDLLMDLMTREGIEFSDRFDAARKAFDLIQKEKV